MISEYIKQFKQLSKNIETAIVTDDRQVVTALDRQISYVWNEILNFEPTNTKESQLLIEFFFGPHIGKSRNSGK